MIEHKLFPTLLGEFHNPRHQEFKDIFYANIFNHMTVDGYSTETTGHVSLHLDPAFHDLFVWTTGCVQTYISRYNIDPDLFDINVIKTWMNITKDRKTPIHNHADAHISFTYYINIPSSAKRPIRFHNFHNRHEPFPGSIRHNNPLRWDDVNSYTWEFEPAEGQLFVFPATLPHETGGDQRAIRENGCTTREQLENSRICLACDMLLTYKEVSAKAMGVQPIKNWKRFT
jgi:hypothetical protein